MTLDWNDVQLFLTVMRAGSLRGAARELRIDVSTVSRRLDQLEQAAGTRLLTRSARRLEFTAAGAHVATTAERMESAVAELQPKLAGADRGAGGLVRVTAPGSLLPVLAAAAKQLAVSHPKIELEVLCFDALLSIDGSQFDVAVRIAEAPPDHLVGSRLTRLRTAVYASHASLKQQRAPLADASHAWVEWDRRLLVKPVFQWLEQQFPSRRIVARGLSTLDVHALVQAGVGVGGLPRIVGDADSALRRLLDVPDELASGLWLLTHPDLRDTPRVRAVMTALRREITQDKAKF